MASTSPKHHPAFTLKRQQTVESLNLEVLEFEHNATGAQHIHLNSESDENVFLVALRTVPKDSTGVAHILEHTALCGSEKYPVRDPFFMMTRRSLNTFMNAFTSSDWTAYPFASLNRKDFNNLLDVYLDAVFFSQLDPLDFAQEGHRLEFEEPDNSDSPLVYKGVVYNEMKGAMSSVPSQLWQTLTKHLFPTSTYHFNSGGDPESIPDLTYEQLVGFYRTHYHPSNAIFMTYGNISALEHQTRFEEQALSKFKRLDYSVSVDDEKRYYAPVRVQESYPYTEDDAEHRTHVVMAWLLGKSTDLEDSLKAQLLSSVLLDNSATPLMHVLESTELGNGPSPLCGLDDSQLELSFLCGLEGCEKHSAEEIEALIVETLQDVAQNGIPQEDIESALHQLELHQREIGGDSYPYGLQLILTALNTATHRGNPVQLLNIDASLNQLRKDIQDPDFIPSLVRDLLLNNPHRVRLTMHPDANINTLKEQAEKKHLETLKASLSVEEKQHIIHQAHALKERQDAKDDPEILPKVTLDDVPKSEVEIPPNIDTGYNRKLSSYAAGTNGLVYQQFIYDLPTLSAEQLQLMPLYTSCIGELGAGDKDYLDLQRWQASVSGSVNVFSSIRGQIDDIHSVQGHLTFSGKALNRNHKPLCDLMQTIMTSARFDETPRIREIIAQIRAHREQGITGNGHGLAMLAATAGFSANAQLSHQLSGLAGIQSIKNLDADIKASENALTAFANSLGNLHSHVTNTSSQTLLVGESAMLEGFSHNLEGILNAPIPEPSAPFSMPVTTRNVAEMWLTNSQVNFCAKAYATVPSSHPDAATLVVLGGFLRNGFLHKTIREQGGAYGGGASQDSNNGAFRFYSYRDPRMEETLNDFDRAIDWMLSEKHSSQHLEEAILGIISSIDKSESPAGRAKRLFHADLHGRGIAYRQQMRERILNTTISDLQRVAETYLQSQSAHTVVISDYANRNKAEKLGLSVFDI
ncbi:insulinase family protein [Teredinibacter purpureus]|uniref:insulinase family protein n=1 Tax=Teredinibacter purpureus TaxID=2731756 RepID=UPI0005F7C4CE|nr:insulinase family protein [Teredinibacter purpureus]